jgi:abortive infection bacteriophage resistance protein
MDKVFMKTNAQMQLLRSRGLQISGSSEKRLLEKENYYNLINGYKPLFLDNSFQGQGERYKAGAKFKELYALFSFDRELRSLFLRYILEIENNVRSAIAHDFAKKYGHNEYLKIANFDISHSNVSDVAELISILQREIANQLRKKNPMIMHYIIEYGYVPPWVLVNIITFGTLSKFYSFLKQKDQNDIGKIFKIMPHDMKVYLKNLALARNCCAHDERFFDIRLKSRIASSPTHASFGLSLNHPMRRYMGKNDIFSLVIIMKQLLPKKAFNKFYYALKSLIQQLSDNLQTISINDVYIKSGFPTTWTDIKQI